MSGLSLIDFDAIWRLSLVNLLMRIIACFLLYTGYLNFVKDPKSHVLLAISSSCTTIELSIILTSCLTAIKYHVIKYCETVFRGMVKLILVYLKLR